MSYFTEIILIIFTAAVGYLLWWRWYAKNYWEKQGVPVATTNTAFTAYRFLYKPLHEIILETYQKYGRIYGAFESRKPILSVSEPELLRDILVKDFHVFPHRREFKSGDELLDYAVSVVKGEDWKRIRTVITPAFTSKRMRQMSNIINECATTLVKSLGKYADSGKPADMTRIFGAFTLDVIALSSFATKINSLDDPENEFSKKVKEFIKPNRLFFLAFFLLPSWLMRYLGLTGIPAAKYFKDIIIQVIQERRDSGKKYNDMLQLLLDARDELEKEKEKSKEESEDFEDESDQFGSVTNKEMSQRFKYNKLTQNELIAQCILFLLVGYHTTAATLGFMAYSLALNPECQDKLIREVDEAYEKHKEFNYDVIRDMKYLDCVLSETLRLYPVAPGSERTAVADYKLGNTGITIEKGTLVTFHIHGMHHDPEFFPDPERFMPERFLSENATHPPYSYLPFGAGPRNCLGMRFAIVEMKLCMSNILRQYRFKKAENTKVPLQFEVASGLLQVKELPLLIEKRH